MAKISVVGSLNVDLSICAPILPKGGETVFGTDFQMLAGGKGLNQAVSAALSGSEVELIGAVGTDAFGRYLTDFLTANGLSTQSIQKVAGATGCALITLHEGENQIIIHPGANALVTPATIAAQEQTIQASDVLITQLELPLDTVQAALACAKTHGVWTLFNPAPMQPLTNELLALVDMIVVNEHECADLTGVSVVTVADAKRALAQLRARGCGDAIITLGSAGVMCEVDGNIIHLPSYRVQAIDTTGAGDTFIGAFATQMANGATKLAALQYASAASALTVSKRGAASAMPTARAVAAFLANQPEDRTSELTNG